MLRGSAWAAREEPQKRRLPEWEDKRARRQAEFTALIPAIAAQVAAEVSAAVSAALQAARVEHHEGLNLAPTTTSMPGTAMATSPTTCSTICLGGNTSATATPASPTTVSTMLHSPAKIEDVHDAVDLGVGDLAASTPTPMLPPRLVSQIVPVMPTICLMEHPGSDGTAEDTQTPATSTCSSALKSLGDAAPPAAAVLEWVHGKQVNASQLSGASLKHFPASSSLFIPKSQRELATTNNIQPLKSFLDRKFCAFVQWPPPLGNLNGGFLLERLWDPDIELLPDDELEPACTSVENLVVKPKPPWSHLAPISSTNEFGSNVRAVSKPLHIIGITFQWNLNDPVAWYILCARAVFYSTKKRQHSVMLMLETLKPSLSLELHVLVFMVMGKEAMLWPMFPSTSRDTVQLLPWDPGDRRIRLRNMRILFQGVTNYESLALVEDFYSFSELLSCRCGSWTSWQLSFFISSSRTASSIHALLIQLKAQDEMKMRLELSLQTVIFSLNCCRIVLHYKGAYSSLQSNECPWFLSSDIQPGTQKLLETLVVLIFSSLPPAIPPDTGPYGILMAPCSRLGVVFVGALVVWSNFTTVNTIDLRVGPLCVGSASDSSATFSKQYVECHTACGPTYPAICAKQVSFESFLVGTSGQVPRKFQPRYLDVSEYFSLAAASVPYNVTPGTAGMVFPYGSVFLGELAGSSMFDLSEIQKTSETWSYILWSRTIVLLLLAYKSSPLKEPMEQWDPGIARIIHICNEYSHFLCHLISSAITIELAHNKLLQNGFHLYATDYAVILGHAHIQAASSVLDRISPSQLDYWLHSCDVGHECFGVSTSFACKVLGTGDRKLMTVKCDNVALLLRVQDVQLLRKPVRSNKQEDTFSESFLSLSMVLREELHLLWDPGGWKLFGLFPQAGSKGRRNTMAPTCYCDHYLDQPCFFAKVCADQDCDHDVLRDQVHIGCDCPSVFLHQVITVCYIKLVKVCLAYYTHDHGEVMKRQVPWDPGGSTRYRLEGKPNFKEGGMLATPFPNIAMGWTVGCASTGPGLRGIHGSLQLLIREDQQRMRRLGSEGFGLGLAWLGWGWTRLADASHLPSLFLCPPPVNP